MLTAEIHQGITFKLAPWQAAAIYSPVTHLAMYGGVGVGKTFTGAHFAIQQMLEHPEDTGFVGANTYDQLSQASLRELFYWLDYYSLEWVIDCMPPPEWGYGAKQFKTYKNILSVRHPLTKEVVHAFTRVLAEGDPLRGIEFSWYWLDETRDTPQNTHDIILSRLRESENIKGIVTTTTNGSDWSWERFKKNGDGKLYGCMHVPTLAAVEAGILTRAYYDTLLHSYSPLMAEQELFARHVNIKAGRAYYAASDFNRRARTPWGTTVPSHDLPLVVGCDFNFSPAPCIWVVGQMGPFFVDRTKKGRDYTQHIHWFRELTGVETSSRSMAVQLLAQFPGFHYEIFGDASGGIGTTSNAGEHDYHQIAEELSNAGATFTLDYDPRNPLVRDRVENMNAKYQNAAGGFQMTYDPSGCPNLDQDNRVVGWKPNTQRGRGKLDDGGDNQRTHASDAAGYAVWKKLPPGKRGLYIEPIPSQATQILAEVG
jgi:hypothetical protein